MIKWAKCSHILGNVRVKECMKEKKFLVGKRDNFSSSRGEHEERLVIIKRTRSPRNGKSSSIWMSIGLESYLFSCK